ncbi:TetR/AcrR family transcriptional regulator [Bacillales bacterium AN1005]
MTLIRIKEVSLSKFSAYGYEGASLGIIANSIGIKKPSIYTYFISKDALFLEVFSDSIHSVLSLISNYFKNKNSQEFKNLLYDFLTQCAAHFEKDDTVRFFMRTAFFPPTHLQAEIKAGLDLYTFRLEEVLHHLFETAIVNCQLKNSEESQTGVVAYISLLHSFFLDLLTGSTERAISRLNAAWSIYWRGLSNEK